MPKKDDMGRYFVGNMSAGQWLLRLGWLRENPPTVKSQALSTNRQASHLNQKLKIRIYCTGNWSAN